VLSERIRCLLEACEVLSSGMVQDKTTSAAEDVASAAKSMFSGKVVDAMNKLMTGKVAGAAAKTVARQFAAVPGVELAGSIIDCICKSLDDKKTHEQIDNAIRFQTESRQQEVRLGTLAGSDLAERAARALAIANWNELVDADGEASSGEGAQVDFESLFCDEMATAMNTGTPSSTGSTCSFDMGVSKAIFGSLFSGRAATSPSTVKAEAAAAAVTALILKGAIRVDVSGVPAHEAIVAHFNKEGEVIVSHLHEQESEGGGGEQGTKGEGEAQSSKRSSRPSLEARSGLRGREAFASASVTQAELRERDKHITELKKKSASLEADVTKLSSRNKGKKK